jgi:ribose transport system permease protein
VKKDVFRSWIEMRPWIWSFLGAAIVWLLIAGVVQGRGAGATLSIALQFATYYVIVGIGQMVVITAGPGNIDLSIPSVMTLAAYLAMGIMRGQDPGLLPGIAVALGVGLGAGLINIILIQGLRIPPMVGTLAAGFVLQSIAIAYSRGSTAKPAPVLLTFAGARVLGIPIISVLFILVAVAVAVALRRTVWGRSVLAVGQNHRAAHLAGIRVSRTIAVAYLLSALLASVAGLLLAGYSGGASLNMAEDYLLISIAVVVLGGTSIAGGSAIVPGVWGASILLYLIVTMLNVMRVSAGLRFVITGLIIIAVLAVAKRRARA